MRKILIISMVLLMFLSGCGDEPMEKDDDPIMEELNITESEQAEEIIEEIDLDCEEGYVQVGDECLSIDPYAVVDGEDENSQEEEEIIEESASEDEENASSDMAATGKQVFSVEAYNYGFMIDGEENPDIRVKVNQTVVIELKSIEGSHNWNVAKFAARSKTLVTNESTVIEFVPFEKGEYDYYCAVGRHENIGQKGKLVVE